MAIVAKRSTPSTLVQGFRSRTEILLMEAAQRDMLRLYPATGVPPFPRRGTLHALLRLLFLPAFKLTPWSLRRRMMSLLFVRKAWPTPGDPRASGTEAPARARNGHS
jgi:hypothetical protein